MKSKLKNKPGELKIQSAHPEINKGIITKNMAIKPEHFRIVARDTLAYLLPEIPYSESAIELLMLTCAQESHMGTYLKQMGNGPALGVMQIEPTTFHDIYENYLKYRPDLETKVNSLRTNIGYRTDLMGNLPYSLALARIIYRRAPSPLPQIQTTLPFNINDKIVTVSDGSIRDLAKYYKKYYNTELGKATVEEAIENYKRFVKVNYEY